MYPAYETVRSSNTLHPRPTLESYHIRKQLHPLNRYKGSLHHAYDHLLKNHFLFLHRSYFFLLFSHSYIKFPATFPCVVVLKLTPVFAMFYTLMMIELYSYQNVCWSDILDWWNRSCCCDTTMCCNDLLHHHHDPVQRFLKGLGIQLHLLICEKCYLP